MEEPKITIDGEEFNNFTINPPALALSDKGIFELWLENEFKEKVGDQPSDSPYLEPYDPSA